MPLKQNGYFISLICAITWSLTGPGVSLINKNFHIQPLQLAFWRVLIMAAALWVGLLLARPHLLKVTRQQLGRLAISGVVGIGIYQALFVQSIAVNGAAIGIVLVYIFPTFVTLGSWLFFKEPLYPSRIIALVLSLLGCALLVRIYEPGVLQLNPAGAILGVLSAFCHACYTLLNRKLSQHAHGTNPVHWFAALTYTFVFGAAALFVFLWMGTAFSEWRAQAETFSWRNATQLAFTIPMQSLPWIAALSLGPTVTGYGLYNLALSKLSGSIVSLIVVAEAPIATIIGVFFLREVLAPLQVLGIILVLLAIVLPGVLDRLSPQTIQ